MATFSFGNLFRKSPRQPRFSTAPVESPPASSSELDDLPVGRVVGAMEEAPAVEPLFKELDEPIPSPFVLVSGTRSGAGTGSEAERLPEDSTVKPVIEGAFPTAATAKALAEGRAASTAVPHPEEAGIPGPESSRAQLPPPRRRPDEAEAPAGAAELTEGITVPPLLPVFPVNEALTDAITSPFQRTDFTAGALPTPPPQTPPLSSGSLRSLSGGSFKRFESPFAVISPAEVSEIITDPFAKKPVASSDPSPSIDQPEPVTLVSLSLSALLQDQSFDSLGFDPARVPASVRVTLPSAPLMAQVASGRIRVRLDELLDGLDAKFKPAFQQTRPGLELVVPMRELFENLPAATPLIPPAPPVVSLFHTPFSIQAAADQPLQPSPEPTPAATLPPPIVSSFLAPAPPPAIEVQISRLDEVAALAASLDSPLVATPEPAATMAAPIAIPALGSLDPIEPARPSFLLLPPALPTEEAAPILPPAAFELAPPSFTPAPASPRTAPTSLPPLLNPFAMPPGAGARSGLGFDLPLMPYDEDPVPLESLRTTESVPEVEPSADRSPFGSASFMAPDMPVSTPEPASPPPLAAASHAVPPPPPIFSFSPPPAAIDLPPADVPAARTETAALMAPMAPMAPVAPVAPAASFTPELKPAFSYNFDPPTPARDAVEPPLPLPAVELPLRSQETTAIEDLSFGYVDHPIQLSLRAVFSTGQLLSTQDVVNHASRLEGLRACLVQAPGTSLCSHSSPQENEDVRHFRERAAVLFEKTASLVRELDPTALEQSFTLRTAKGVVSFFAVGDVCLAVLHAEPTFRPGVREKLTLVVRSLAEMLAAA